VAGFVLGRHRSERALDPLGRRAVEGWCTGVAATCELKSAGAEHKGQEDGTHRIETSGPPEGEHYQ
jgi:hypothetical protein